jgi:ATP-binding protein involved in chromosome partitioning
MERLVFKTSPGGLLMLNWKARKREKDSIDEEQVLEALRSVHDPDLHRDIVSLNFVKNVRICGGKVAFDLELTTPACPVKEKLKAEAEAAVRQIPGVEQVTVNMTARVRGRTAEKADLLPNVRNIVAVASGKGGVGKSTVAVNLAVALAQTGASVGLLDADVYGPTVPQLLGTHGGVSSSPSGTILPLTAYGVKLMSLGLFASEDAPVIWRGPMASKLVQQFLSGVEWGSLDYLLIDLPPGTGDIALTLVQSVPLSGAVIVTTPQDVALKVAQKGLRMFYETNVPVLGVIENMSGYVCPHCGKTSHIFPHGSVQKLCRELDVPYLGAVPIDPKVAVCGDTGVPIAMFDETSPAANAFAEIAGAVAAKLSAAALQGGTQSVYPEQILQGDTSLVIKWNDGHTSEYPYPALRAACRCAACSDENTGELLINIEDIPKDIRPIEISPVGRYGISIRWSDGHDTGIYPFSRLRKMCGCSECTP